MHLDVNRQMETSVKNLFAAGDGAGLSRDIVNAAATGIMAAEGILKQTGKGVTSRNTRKKQTRKA
jgi:uncharacterized FAD-dependent dehydrogenase